MSLKEEDFSLLKGYIPRSFAGLLLGSLIYSGIMLLISIYAVHAAHLEETIWATLKDTNIVAWVTHLLFAIFFLSEKRAYAFQRTLSVVSCLSLIKMAVEGFLIYFLICADGELSSLMYNLGYSSMLGALLFLIISFIRAIYLAAKGHLRSGGKGLYDFYNKKWRVIFITVGMAIAFAMFIGALTPWVLASTSREFMAYVEDLQIQPLIGLFIFSIILYLLVLIMPEAFLKTYCLFRYRSFRDPLPVRRTPKRKKAQQVKQR